MARKRKPTDPSAPPPEKAADRHLHPKITLRLPPEVGEALRVIAEKEERTITAIVLRSLREYFRANDYPWPS